METEKLNDSIILRVHKEFDKTVWDFIDKYSKEIGIKISTTSATKIINDKIKKFGGLKIP